MPSVSKTSLGIDGILTVEYSDGAVSNVDLVNSSSSKPTLSFTSRVLTSNDNGAKLTVVRRQGSSHSQTATMVVGLGTSFGCAFYNKTDDFVVLEISVPAGVTVNGVTNGIVTRTIPAWGVTVIQATDVADVYVAPEA
jgi:hypothetical protein